MDFDQLVSRSSRLLHSLSLPGVALGDYSGFVTSSCASVVARVVERLPVRKRDRQALSALVVFLNTLGKPLFQAGNGVRCGGLGDLLLRDQFAEETEHRAEQFAARRRHAVAMGLAVAAIDDLRSLAHVEWRSWFGAQQDFQSVAEFFGAADQRNFGDIRIDIQRGQGQVLLRRQSRQQALFQRFAR